MTRTTKLRQICLDYLQRLRGIAEKHGLSEWLNKAIKEASKEECVATEEEVMLLSRAVDDERITRTDVPTILGKSYRACFDEEHFEKIKKLRHVGIYSKVDTLLYANYLESDKLQKT